MIACKMEWENFWIVPKTNQVFEIQEAKINLKGDNKIVIDYRLIDWWEMAVVKNIG